uniref:Uncharacterized protein n=1 Tax=viral metagenome TaxID=1070528 RepID=A0A6M3KCI6_9ZZZZ
MNLTLLPNGVVSSRLRGFILSGAFDLPIATVEPVLPIVILPDGDWTVADRSFVLSESFDFDITSAAASRYLWAQDGLLLTSGGALATNEGCCCACPCMAAQAAVSITTTASYGECDIEGDKAWYGYESAYPWCRWHWVWYDAGQAAWYMVEIERDPLGDWYVTILWDTDGDSGGDPESLEWTNLYYVYPAEWITCGEDGGLTGTGDLPGVGACATAPDTATLTLNGAA